MVDNIVEHTYSKHIQCKNAFKQQVFKHFTQACGGSLDTFTDFVYNRHTVEDFGFADDLTYWSVLGYFNEKVVPHKIAVFQSGLEFTRHEWFKKLYLDKSQYIENLWLHDISKFSANESFGYALHDFKSQKEDILFNNAWLHHKNHNPHHPEYWVNPNRDGSQKVLEMPTIYIVEMLADWIGAGMVYGGSLSEWLPKNISTFLFHENTAKSLILILSHIGHDTEWDGQKIKVKCQDKS